MNEARIQLIAKLKAEQQMAAEKEGSKINIPN